VVQCEQRRAATGMTLRHSGTFARRRLLAPPGPRGDQLHRLDDEEEHRRGDRGERDQRVDEVAVAEAAVVDREREAAEVGLADDRRDDRGDQVGDERIDQCDEGDADDERDGQLDDVAAEEELSELLEDLHLGVAF
jgi:hypothetical protein